MEILILRSNKIRRANFVKLVLKSELQKFEGKLPKVMSHEQIN